MSNIFRSLRIDFKAFTQPSIELNFETKMHCKIFTQPSLLTWNIIENLDIESFQCNQVFQLHFGNCKYLSRVFNFIVTEKMRIMHDSYNKQLSLSKLILVIEEMMFKM